MGLLATSRQWRILLELIQKFLNAGLCEGLISVLICIHTCVNSCCSFSQSGDLKVNSDGQLVSQLLRMRDKFHNLNQLKFQILTHHWSYCSGSDWVLGRHLTFQTATSQTRHLQHNIFKEWHFFVEDICIQKRFESELKQNKTKSCVHYHALTPNPS